MTAEYHERLSEAFAKAAEMTPDRRRDFLDRIGARDPKLRADVESLLDQESDLPPILTTGAPLTDDPDLGLPLPTGIGPYRIVRRIGEGGMGVVFEAQQDDPIRRRVALKLIRAGFESRHVVARFDAERDVLARLDHPGIARVVDAGTTAHGAPYFAMELVAGTPITAYCDRNRLGVRDRLSLFLQVCAGVEHAHRNAIIHRDIKPSNILVADHPDGPAPKIIDFGVAKALHDAREDPALVTRTGQWVGTPAYMSPEQASGQPDLDTRTDVYSLGAVLYELLVGKRPMDAAAPGTSEPDELRRQILEVDPMIPSERLAALRAEAAVVARDRGVAPGVLRRQVRGDLDWIVTRALEKTRARRYGSVTELADDIRRHLEHRPVQATPPRMLYRVRKFARRHRTGLALTAVLLPILLGFVVAQVVQTQRTARERGRADQVSEFLIDFYATQPLLIARHSGEDLETIVGRGVDKAQRDLADRPDLQARLILVLGQTLMSAGDVAAAERALEIAWSRLRDLRGEDDPSTLHAATGLAKVRTLLRKYDDAEALLSAVLNARLRAHGEGHADTARAQAELAYFYKLTKELDRSARLYESALPVLRDSLGSDHREAVLAASLLGSVYLDLRHLAEAESVLLDALPRLEEQDPEIGLAHYNLAAVAALRGERDRALELLRRAVFDHGVKIRFLADPNFAPVSRDPEFVELARRIWITNPNVAAYRFTEARSLIDQGRYDEAEPIFRGFVRDLPWGGARELWLLGRLHMLQQRYAEAETRISEFLDARTAIEGPDHPERAIRLRFLAQCRLGQGDRDGAIAILEESVDILQRSREIVAPDLEYSRALLDIVRGDREGALRHLRAAVDFGFWDYSWQELDPMLSSLRGTPGYESVVADMARGSVYP